MVVDRHTSSAPDSVSFLNLPFLESLYERFKREPDSVTAEWRDYFRTFDGAPAAPPRHAGASGPRAETAATIESDYHERLDELIESYRTRGHLAARINPLGSPGDLPPELEPAFHGLAPKDLERPLPEGLHFASSARNAASLIARLQASYCGSIGAEFMHIENHAQRQWVQERMDRVGERPAPPVEEQARIFTLLTKAELLERFLRRKYVGAHSFSVEGCESLLALLEFAVEQAGASGVDEVVLGMAHRGRLNVLVNVLGKRTRDVLREFEDRLPHEGHGDVKYHLGASSDRVLKCGRKMHLCLCFNPSHLEFINPVVCGRVRAKQDRAGDVERRRGIALQIHGDAAFTGQGVIQETLNFSELRAYRIGGSLHVMVNNQIGFTTQPDEGRSTRYATDIAKILDVPIFHVNADDPEAVVTASVMAMDFRNAFAKDVIVDLVGYRRLGHNESDEPSYTQPLMYQAIKDHPTVTTLYLEKLIERGSITREGAEEIAAAYEQHLDAELASARSDDYEPPSPPDPGPWKGLHGGPLSSADDVDTAVPRDRLIRVLFKLASLPQDFHLHPRLERLIHRRKEMAEGKRPIDWATSEALAFGTLALEGIPVRLTGQDTQRGTFSQRHAVFHDVVNENRFAPLSHLAEDQAAVTIENSPLSETGVMGFEYGYSLDYPDALVMWEAQYGDFVNAGQVIIDQFIASAEAKWRRLSGLVLLLPHGFDGQGPEHSSARLERFLTLAADDNIQVASVSTPAQYFHLLRRQALRKWRKPLIVMTPKNLLRHPRAVSSLEELAGGRFQPVLGDENIDAKTAGAVLLCTGKIYYELREAREKLPDADAAIVRVEELYPFPAGPLESALRKFGHLNCARWVQEEPENMGAWRFLRSRAGDRLSGRLPLQGVSRPESSTPGGGSSAQHKAEQAELVQQALAGLAPVPVKEPG